MFGHGPPESHECFRLPGTPVLGSIPWPCGSTMEHMLQDQAAPIADLEKDKEHIQRQVNDETTGSFKPTEDLKNLSKGWKEEHVA